MVHTYSDGLTDLGKSNLSYRLRLLFQYAMVAQISKGIPLTNERWSQNYTTPLLLFFEEYPWGQKYGYSEKR